MKTNKKTVFLGTGDCQASREDMFSIFEHVAPVLSTGDIVYGQCEPVLTLGHEDTPVSLTCSTNPSMAAAMKKAGFTDASVAGNHTMDWGYYAAMETLEHLRKAGLNACGAGRNLSEARKPIFTEANGIKFALLSYSSVFYPGFEATYDLPGINPMRALNYYEPLMPDHPGTPPRVITFPHPDDMKHMLEDIEYCKNNADVVVLGVHWGLMYNKQLADYQQIYAHAAIDAGVDVIIGHHPHVIKPIEIYKGKPIFYSVGQFAGDEFYSFKRDGKVKKDISDVDSHHATEGFKNMIFVAGDGWDEEERARVGRSFPPHIYKHFIAKVVFDGTEIESVSYLPTYQPLDCAPRMLKESDKEFAEINKWVADCCELAQIPINLTVRNNEVFVYEREKAE